MGNGKFARLVSVCPHTNTEILNKVLIYNYRVEVENVSIGQEMFNPS